MDSVFAKHELFYIHKKHECGFDINGRCFTVEFNTDMQKHVFRPVYIKFGVIYDETSRLSVNYELSSC